MQKLLEIVNWPAKRGNTYSPWYVIAWRILWIPILWAGFFFCLFATFMSYGKNAAKDFYKWNI